MPQATTASAFGRQTIDPFVGGNRLAGVGIGSKSRPVALFLDLLVGNGALDHQDERIKFPLFGQVPVLEKIVAVLVSKDRIVQMHCR